MKFELDEVQKKAVKELDNGKILCGGVGSGKTITALAYYVENESPRPLYVITTAKKRDDRDWEEEANHFGIGREISKHGTITVDSWNNLKKYKDVQDAFFIFDEQRLVGSGEWVRSFYKVAKVNRWILLTATPGDNWMDYIPVFVANGFYKNKTQFLNEHVVFTYYTKFPKVQRYIGQGKLLKKKRELLVEMPLVKHTRRHLHTVVVNHDHELLEKVVKQRWHVYENRPLRDVSELFAVMRKVANTDSSRLKVIQDLSNTHPRLIVFYNFDYELDILRTLERSTQRPFESRSIESSKKNSIETRSKPCEVIPETLTVAEWNGHKHQPIPTSKRWVYLVQYTAGAEGWNCTTSDAMVFYSLNYSYKVWEQAQGRIDRRNTPFTDLHYYILMSDSVIDRAVKKALDMKRNFNERGFWGHELG